jgi:hypothetical protein
MVSHLPALGHDLRLGGYLFERLQFPTGVKKYLMIGFSKEEKLLVEALGSRFILGQNEKRPSRLAGHLRKQVSGRRALQAMNLEEAPRFF